MDSSNCYALFPNTVVRGLTLLLCHYQPDDAQEFKLEKLFYLGPNTLNLFKDDHTLIEGKDNYWYRQGVLDNGKFQDNEELYNACKHTYTIEGFERQEKLPYLWFKLSEPLEGGFRQILKFQFYKAHYDVENVKSDQYILFNQDMNVYDRFYGIQAQYDLAGDLLDRAFL